MTIDTNDILDYKDPGTMDDELFRVPGMANELMNLTLANAPRPNPPIAFMGALARDGLGDLREPRCLRSAAVPSIAQSG